MLYPIELQLRVGRREKESFDISEQALFQKNIGRLDGGPSATSFETPLDSPARAARCSPFHQTLTMGQQYNKGIKKKRRLAYLKRKKEAAKVAAKKTAKAKK